MAHGLLDDGDGDALLGEDACVGVAQGVDINHAIHRVALLDSGKGQVTIENFIESGWHLKQLLFGYGMPGTL